MARTYTGGSGSIRPEKVARQVLRNIVARMPGNKTMPIADEECIKMRESDLTKLTNYLYYCEDCHMINTIYQTVDETHGLLQKHFCLSCQEQLFGRRNDMNDELEKIRTVEQMDIDEIAKDHAVAITTLRDEFESNKTRVEKEFEGLGLVERSIGKAVIVKKEELIEGMMLQLVSKNNKEVIEKKKKRDKEDNGPKRPSDLINLIDDTSLGTFCLRTYRKRIREEKETQQAVQEKGW